MTVAPAVARATLAPMTRAQKFQWHLEKGTAEGLRRLPDRQDTESVRAVVESLQRRYEMLRTSIDLVDGDLCQRVHESGEPVETVDVEPAADVAALASALAEEFARDTVGRVGRILVRFHLLRHGAARWLAVLADSTAVDRAFYEMIDRTLTDLLGQGTGEPETRAGLQATQLAALEDSPGGRAERQEARDYLRRHYSTAPPPLHPRPGVDRSRAGRYYRCGVTVPRADGIFAHILDTTGRLPSAVLLGTFAYLLCWRADAPSCTVNVSMENRHTRDLRTAVCATAQRAPIALHLSGTQLGDAVGTAESALSAAYPVAGRYDPVDLLAERATAEARRGLCLTPDLAFNFNPPPQGWTALLRSAGPAGAPADGPGEVDTATTNETSYEYGASLSVRWRDEHAARLSVHGDSDVLSVVDCVAVLRCIELGLTTYARHPDAVDMGAVVGLVGLVRRGRHPREAGTGDDRHHHHQIEEG